MEEEIKQIGINQPKSNILFYVVLGIIFVVVITIVIALFFILGSSDSKSIKSNAINPEEVTKIKNLYVPYNECMSSCDIDSEGLVTSSCYGECKTSLDESLQTKDLVNFDNLENVENFYVIRKCISNCKRDRTCSNDCLNSEVNIDYELLREYYKKVKDFWDSIIECVDECPTSDSEEKIECAEVCFNVDDNDQFDFSDEEFEKIKVSGIYKIMDDYPFYVNKCLYCTDYPGCTGDCYEKVPLGTPIKEFTD